MEPFIKILYSECDEPKFCSGSILSLGDANSLFEQKDFICSENKIVINIVYEISYAVNSDVRTYCCSQNLGNGEGSVINYLRKETIDALEELNSFGFQESTLVSKKRNPFGVLKKACENMLNVVLPELEAYCLAYRANEIICSCFIEKSDSEQIMSIDEYISLIKKEPFAFIQTLENIILTNPDNTSLIFAIEGLIDKTERYMQFVTQKESENGNLVDILKEASQRATIINSKSIFYDVEPPLEQDETEEFLCRQI